MITRPNNQDDLIWKGTVYHWRENQFQGVRVWSQSGAEISRVNKHTSSRSHILYDVLNLI